jgi:uncharacterized membrane protein YeaQ/YmgE (transglycosylase-associated protein family)
LLVDWDDRPAPGGNTVHSQRTSPEEVTIMLGLIISILVVGIIAGAIARLVVPGKQNLSIGMTIVLGVVGSFVGGFLGFLIFGADAQEGFFQPAGIIGSIIGAIIVLIIWIQVRGRSAARR